MKNIFLYFIFLFIFSSFVERLDYSARAEKIKYKTLQRLKQRFDFSSMGGGGAYQGNVNNISMMLRLNQFATIEQAREIYIYFMNEFIQALNEDLTIRPYLNHYPADQYNIELSLLFKYNKEDANTPNETVESVSLIKNKVVYFGERSSIFEEPYEEALKIITHINN